VTFSLLLFLALLSFLGLLALFVLRKVLHLRLWFIGVLFLGVGLVLHFATLRMLT